MEQIWRCCNIADWRTYLGIHRTYKKKSCTKHRTTRRFAYNLRIRLLCNDRYTFKCNPDGPKQSGKYLQSAVDLNRERAATTTTYGHVYSAPALVALQKYHTDQKMANMFRSTMV